MRRSQVKKKRKVPEALGNRVCGVRPYVIVLVLNAAVHITFFFLFGQTLSQFFRLFFSFIFFIYPLHYVTDILWALRPSVCAILSGKTKINRKHYMNTVQSEFAIDSLFPVTISIPVHTESNDIIFQTLRDSLAAIRRYHAISRKEANIVVSDDGIAPLLGFNCTRKKVDRLIQIFKDDDATLTQPEKKAIERIQFYRDYEISFVVRPASGRAGLFKKASNLNYTLRLGNAIRSGAPLESLVKEGGDFAGGYAEGNITTHEVILLLDKDSGVNERIIEAILPEFALDERLAYVQCATNASNLYENYYTYATGHQVNNLFHNIWPCKAMQGYFVPLAGHNVFLRKSILEKSGLWSEDKVSEDFDKAICFYGMGYHGKYAQLKGLEFTEYASRTFTEETCKQRRYAYGLFEMMFDGTIAPGKARGCDTFYLTLYFLSVINQVLLVPTALVESYFGNIYLLWAGFLFCSICYIVFPLVRSFVMRRRLPKEHSETFIHTLTIALSFVAHSFSFLAGACRYLTNKIKENKKPFPATNVNQLEYRFIVGVKLLIDYICKNPWLPFLAFLCLDRGIYFLTDQGLEPMTKFTYCYILFCAVFVPVLLTPQLFGSYARRTKVIEKMEVTRLGDRVAISSVAHYESDLEGSVPSLDMTNETENTGVSFSDIERFLQSYRETLEASLPNENMPEEILDDYDIESCIRKEPDGKKELYVLRRKNDDQRALLRITKDYPQEDALEEAKLLAGLNHPGIPKVFASYEKDGRRYLIREYLEGRSLSEIVETGGSLAAKDIFNIALKLIDILSYLHAQTPPVIHRDIKPQNIIAGKDGNIHLIDFGIARVHKEARRQDTAVILTLDYASPEQYGFEQTTPLSDIYSFGVVLLFLATGRTIRSGLEAQIVNNKLRILIEQCIAFNPKARIQSVDAIRDYILHDHNRQASRRKRRLVAAAALLASAIALGTLFYGVGFITGKNRAEKRSYARGFDNGYTDGYVAAPIFDRSKPDATAKGGSNAGNMAVFGGAFAAQSESFIFYIGDEGIWRMSANGTEKQLLIRNAEVMALSYQNGWLYYSSGDTIMQTNIYTLESDVLSEGIKGELYVTGDLFYVRTENSLHRLDLKTGETTALDTLPPRCLSLNADGTSLYYIGGDDFALYRSDADGNNPLKLANGTFRSACLFGSDLFCALHHNGQRELVKINSKTGESEKLLEVDAATLVVMEHGIYFLDCSDGTINRCSFDGRIREKVSKNRASDFNIAGNWIFYHNVDNSGRLWCVRLDGSNDHSMP
ncbi:MAG TPA: DUF5050 domain-containing protein [Clostridiaceae bacterium]|nr:DUF5050 domain-containing protein [Clostridiaceae bacterium]